MPISFFGYKDITLLTTGAVDSVGTTQDKFLFSTGGGVIDESALRFVVEATEKWFLIDMVIKMKKIINTRVNN